ncbi:MAG: hypothetical protein JWQ69_5420 [Pseudomonas sp.]|nr:hypothetical protein [Pseudomonas sp.]
MPEANQSAGSGSRAPHERHLTCQERLGRIFGPLFHHLPAALIVASLVNIGHHDFHWLDAVDGYAFFALGNRSAFDALHNNPRNPKVAVVLIDPPTHEERYRERSPLDRCELARELESIYEYSSPEVLVIDLDLSPILAISPILTATDQAIKKKEDDCQENLDALLTRTEDMGVKRVTKTILMQPFDVEDQAGELRINAWTNRMKAANIPLGDASAQVRYGLVTKIECKPDGLAALAYVAYGVNTPSNCLERFDLFNRCPVTHPPLPEEDYEDLLINPSQYLLGLRPVSVSKLPSLETPLSLLPVPPYRLPVVFFGSAYGEDDTYSTPLGTLYGVEVHAAAFMSLLNPTSEHTKLLGFVMEIAFALALGWLISWCWRHYYGMRFSGDAWRRQFSPYFILGLGLLLISVVFLATYLSFLFLSQSNLWLSPIPIAIGMTVESLFNGAVHEAVHEGHEQRQSLLHRLEEAYRVSVAHFNKTLAHEKRERPRDVHHLKERFRRFIFLDVQRLYQKRKYFAVFLLVVRRLLFLSLLVLGLFAIFKH